MYDNNIRKENKQIGYDVTNSEAINFLKNLLEEAKEQLNSLLIQKKNCKFFLKDKEEELSKIEQTKSNNYVMFSPIYNQGYDTKNLSSEIVDLKKIIDQLEKEQDILEEKRNKLLNIVDHMESIYNDINEDKTTMAGSTLKKSNDIGLGLLEAQESERQRIARDLHDSTVQNLTNLVHKSELCIKLIDMDSIRAKLELNTMSNTIKAVINEMRDVIYDLKPMSLDDLGLVVTIERYMKQLKSSQNIQVKIHNNTEIKGVLPVINLTLFRIIQEACCNVIKHAHAQTIDIGINYYEKEITVSVTDDGIGFDLDKHQKDLSEQSSSFGLSIMRERISLLSGTLKIQSENGKGTIITVSVPLIACEGEKNE